jgi:hypothetical protein
LFGELDLDSLEDVPHVFVESTFFRARRFSGRARGYLLRPPTCRFCGFGRGEQELPGLGGGLQPRGPGRALVWGFLVALGVRSGGGWFGLLLGIVEGVRKCVGRCGEDWPDGPG